MRNTDQSSASSGSLLGLEFAISSLKYGFGTLHEPGPGFITFFAGAILIILSFALFLSSFKNPEGRSNLQSLWGRSPILVRFSTSLFFLWPTPS